MNEYYYQLIVTPDDRPELFAEILLDMVQNAIEEKEGSLIVRDSDPLDDIAWAIEKFGEKIGIGISTQQTKERNEDWIDKYKASVKPISVGNFYIRPQWENPKEHMIDIIINPALAFGSGHHETTYSCLQMINDYVKKDDTLLDVGCGSGILSIAAAKLGARVDICDTDEVAVKSAQENFTRNQIDFAECWVGSVQNAPRTYDVVVANIIADVLLLLHNDLKKAVNQGGILILSGIIDKYIDQILEKYKDFETLETIQNKEWYTLVLKRI